MCDTRSSSEMLLEQLRYVQKAQPLDLLAAVLLLVDTAVLTPAGRSGHIKPAEHEMQSSD